ncbi:MAG: RNA methyltransferase [Candidatus Harrisonbacteria bacterium]|nr:RNA methyltransferase [Candidatus Harrisonbacteria bacterium]
MVVILHNIRSLHNVGSIFRTADAAGIEKLYLCGITSTPFDVFGHPRAQIAKVALGAEKTVPWEHARSTTKTIERLKRDGYKIVALEQSKKSAPYYTLRATRFALRKVALVVGHEVKGTPAILKRCDAVIEIPMYGKKESLNVAVAFGIVAFGLRLPYESTK